MPSGKLGRRRLMGQPMIEPDSRRLIDDELGLTRGCAAVLAVSEAERQLFAAAGSPERLRAQPCRRAAPDAEPVRTPPIRAVRGSVQPDSPNDDAVTFLCREVLPALRTAGCNAPSSWLARTSPETSDTAGRCHGHLAFGRRRPDAALRRRAGVRGADPVLGRNFVEGHRGRGERRADRLHASVSRISSAGCQGRSC